MVPIQLEDKRVIPGDLTDLAAFRRWAQSDQFPEYGRFAYLAGKVWVDLSMEQAYTHNQVKTRINSVLDSLALSLQLGNYFSDGLDLSNPAADLSTVPDGMLVTYEALRAGRVCQIEGSEGGCIELVGTPDMVLEVVSKTSVHKDTVELRRLYWLAEVSEYWLIDARGAEPRFDLLRRGARGYTATRRQGGWLRSPMFGRSFQLSRQTDPLGNPQFILAQRP